MKKLLLTSLLIFSCFSLFVSCVTEQTASPVDFNAYKPGVTVEADALSPTGFTATFIYKEEDTNVYLVKNEPVELGDIVKVELYSDCFLLFTEEDGFSVPYTPDMYRPGMNPAGGNGDTTYYVEMEEFAPGLWGVQLPLSSGAFVYNFQLTDADGNSAARQDDPSNPTMVNKETGISSLSSMVYVPYNKAKMGEGLYADRSIENPCSQAGKVDTISYTGAAGDKRGLAVYLPYGYDPERAEPYKVLYISHGASGDKVGNEMRWLNEGCVANITDNLIAAGKTEPYVVVAMNNQDLGWDFSKIEDEQFNYIMPLIEEKYNVCNSAEGRAFAGLSMGGITTSNMYMNHPEDFSYFGVWSAANKNIESFVETLKGVSVQPKIMAAAGVWDFGLQSAYEFADKVEEQVGVTPIRLTVPGAHDWETWQLIYAYAAENFFWK